MMRMEETRKATMLQRTTAPDSLEFGVTTRCHV